MKVNFLGTGTSVGVPMLVFDHPIAQSKDPRDTRLRSSILVHWQDKTLLIDCGPDFRQQMLRANCKKIDAVLYTHEHSDHIAGLDDIRPYTLKYGPMPIYATSRVLQALEKRFDYIFATKDRYPGAASVVCTVLDPQEQFTVENISITPINVAHGLTPVLGFRIGDLVYITDCKEISASEIEKVKGAKVLIINALRQKEHPTHFSLQQALDFIALIAPEKAYLTHISQDMGFHEEVQDILPNNVYLAHDNLTIEF